jgi:hypothetical protein
LGRMGHLGDGAPREVPIVRHRLDAPLRETKPISAVQRGTGIPSAALSGQALPVSLDHRQDADATVRPDGGKCAKQSQFPAGQKEGQNLGGKGLMVNRTFDRPRRNKANSGRSPVGRGPWRSIVQNEANSRRTGRVPCGSSLGPRPPVSGLSWAIVRNKANCSGRPRPPDGTLTGCVPRRRLSGVCGLREVRAGRHKASEASERKVSR